MFFDIFVDDVIRRRKKISYCLQKRDTIPLLYNSFIEGYKLEEMEDANTKLIARNGKWNLSRLLL